MRGKGNDFDKESIKKLVREFVEEYDTVKVAEYKKLKHKNMPTPTTILRYFESWSALIIECGYKPVSRKYTKSAMQDYLLSLSEELGRPPRHNEIESIDHVRKYWGNFSNMLVDVFNEDYIYKYGNDPVKLRAAAETVIKDFYAIEKRFPTVTEWREQRFSPTDTQLFDNDIRIPLLIQEIKNSMREG